MALTSGTREMAQRVRRPRQYESATTSICGLFRVGVRIAEVIFDSGQTAVEDCEP